MANKIPPPPKTALQVLADKYKDYLNTPVSIPPEVAKFSPTNLAGPTPPPAPGATPAPPPRTGG